MPSLPPVYRAVPRPRIVGTYPENDDFTANTSAPDTTYLTGNYIKFQAFSSGSIIVDATTFWPTNRWCTGASMNLHNGWFTTQGTGTATTYNNGGPAAATMQGTADAGAVSRQASLCGFMHRVFWDDDVELQASFKFAGVPSGVVAGATRTYSFGFALGARLRGTQVSGGATGTTHGSMSGYYFGLFGEHQGTGAGVNARLRWLLIKMNAGVATVVASATPTGLPANFLFPLSGSVRTNPDKWLRFTCVTVAGVVQLRGYSVDSQGVSTQVLSYDDSTTPILTAGRAGIVMSCENSEAGATVTGVGDMEHLCNWWSAQPFGGNVEVREQWERFYQYGGLVVTPTNITYPHTLAKHSLLSAWFGDYFSLTNATGGYTNSFRLDAANNRAKCVASTNSSRVFSMSERIANDPQFQDRQVDIVFENAGPTTAREAGIVLFGSVTGTTSATALSSIQKGYVLVVEYTAAGAFNLVLYRARGVTAPVQIVKKTGVAGLALGTSFTLRLYCDTQVVPTPKTGYVRLAAFINGVQQTWDLGPGYYNDAGVSQPANGAASYQVQAGGSVIDKKSTRVSSGLGQGIVFQSAAVATANVFFDSWLAGTGDAPYEDPESQQASISVAAEDDTTSGTFSVPIEWGTAESELWQTRDHRFDSDHRYVAVAQNQGRRRWNVGNKAATSSEISTLKSFFDSHKGAEIPFNWTTPKGEAVVVRFRNDSLVIEQITPSIYSWSSQFEEVIAE